MKAKKNLRVIGLMIIAALATGGTAFGTERYSISISYVRALENPRSDGEGEDNSYLLEGMPNDVPNFCAAFADGYDDCTVGFYDANLELLDSWREPVADGDMVMCATAGDIDNDAHNEIVLTTRSGASGVHALRWNPQTREVDEMWSFLDTPTVQTQEYFRGTAIGNFTNHEGREVCFGGARTGLYLVDQHGQLIAHDLTITTIAAVVQRIDICDNDGDGYDEMIISTGRDPGQVHYCRWRPEDHTLEVLWSANVTPSGRGGHNCYEALYHPNGHPEGGPAIAANTEQESGTLAGSFLLLDMTGQELWCYVYSEDEGRGGGCDFADITGNGLPEIISRYSTGGPGVIIMDNTGRKLAKIPNVEASSAGPYVFRPNGPATKPVYLLAQTHVYEITVETPWGAVELAWDPDPCDAEQNVHPGVVLSWKAGIEAASHDVYFGTDVNAVSDANTSETLDVYMGRQGDCEYDPAILLELGQTYYWRIDEVNDVNIWKGEVWSFTVVDDDGKAGNPSPANGATDVAVETVLSWSAGLVAGSHDVYFGTDFDAVNDANTSCPEYKGNQPLVPAEYDPPALLEFARTYYWRIDQVNPGYSDSKGDVWSFTVMEYIIVDDMESYNTTDNKIIDTWLDVRYNATGAYLRLGADPCDPVNSGWKSMQYEYENDGGLWGDLHYYAEVVRTFSVPCDWTKAGMKVLTLYFYGNPDNDANATEQMYMGLQDANSYAQAEYGDNGEDMNDIRISQWHQWNIRLQDFNDAGVDLSDIRKIYIGFGDRSNPIPGGSGVVLFDDIELCSQRCIEPAPNADINGDCTVDHGDLRLLADHWLASGVVAGDLYPDSKINYKDFAVLANEWLDNNLWP
jgi:hypothetical protein